jgi:hypothetical protein
MFSRCGLEEQHHKLAEKICVHKNSCKHELAQAGRCGASHFRLEAGFEALGERLNDRFPQRGLFRCIVRLVGKKGWVGGEDIADDLERCGL